MPSFSKLLSVALVTLAATSSVSGSGLRVRDCPRGQKWNGRECVVKKVECGRDQVADGLGGCVDKIDCGRDQVDDGRGGCVDKQVVCRNGQVDDGRGGCVDKKVECGRDQVDDGRGGCVDKVKKVQCGRDQVANGRGGCVDKVKQVVCRIGQVDDGRGGCVDKKVKCGRGQQLNRAGDGCEAIPKPDVDTRVKVRTPVMPAGPTDEEVANAALVIGMKKHTDKVACNKNCKRVHAKPLCAGGRAGKACRKDKSWQLRKATCLKGCKA